jgi:hypothetical protein
MEVAGSCRYFIEQSTVLALLEAVESCHAESRRLYIIAISQQRITNTCDLRVISPGTTRRP